MAKKSIFPKLDGDFPSGFPFGGRWDSPMEVLMRNNPVEFLSILEEKEERMLEISPDTYGCKRFFLEFFVTEEMESDFPLIARDFLLHELPNLSGYENVEYIGSRYDKEHTPSNSCIRYVLNLMMNAVDGGSEYTKALFLYLYRTYYKKEYKTLKKFSSLSHGEVFALAVTGNEESLETANISRILFIAGLLGIVVKPDCNSYYDYLNKISDEIGQYEDYSYEQADENYAECLRYVREDLDQKKLYRLDDRMSRFLGNRLKQDGYPPYYIDMCDEYDEGMFIYRLAETKAILEKTFPDREFSEEDLVVYSTIIKCSDAITDMSISMRALFEKLVYGEKADMYYTNFPPLFHPEAISGAGRAEKKSTLGENRLSERKKEPASQAGSVDELLEAIDALRKRNHILESDNKNLHYELAGKRKLEAEAGDTRKELELANRELAALRDYVYNLTEYDAPIEADTIEDMKKAIARRRILIIGGHSNWVSKMKKEFPDWTFIDPDPGASTEAAVADKAEKVYFFSDCISHAKYYLFINAVREKRIDFGYIHGVNIERTIRTIYNDFSG